MGVYQSVSRRVEAWPTADNKFMVLLREDGELARIPNEQFAKDYQEVSDRRKKERRHPQRGVRPGGGSTRRSGERRARDPEAVDRAKRAFEASGSISKAAKAAGKSYGTIANWKEKFGWKYDEAKDRPTPAAIRERQRPRGSSLEDREASMARDSSPESFRGAFN